MAIFWGWQGIQPGQSATPPLQGGFEFALIGDLPYTPEQAQQFQRLITDVNQTQAAFVIHDGDIKSSIVPCQDTLFLDRRRLFQQFQAPFVLVPGDNDWTDCHRTGEDPEERLAKVRSLFFDSDNGLKSFALNLTHQSEKPQFREYVENVRWRYGSVLFAGIHVVGSNNNLGRSASGDAEYRRRNEANLDWLKQAFAVAQQPDYDALVLIIHANPNFGRGLDSGNNGFRDFLQVLETQTTDFSKPVVLVHGDSHYFQIDKPLVNHKTKQRLMHFTRVETFGDPDVHWVSGRFDPSLPQKFQFEPRVVTQNR
ncbi:hypothetical protein GS597_18360 [Synechococcales cyanobacterium C]|uniref:Calcineurin-like phosphoesterase domain-containing protein n=1 Tax=Petrachloros mirabilis ULC683 TaxID=2781853 RepID=A0A8K2A9U8_9CYAN|nr:hypothetical protein [Petrachloros mirabilis]NCJ08435.1 hypothetical protein [Petrachloros mirabilis ULC683]